MIQVENDLFQEMLEELRSYQAESYERHAYWIGDKLSRLLQKLQDSIEMRN